MDKSDYQPPTYDVPYLYDGERVVIDLEGRPVKAYRDIPLTLSSEVEGGLLQAIVDYHPRITWPDLKARLSVLSRFIDGLEKD